MKTLQSFFLSLLYTFFFWMIFKFDDSMLSYSAVLGLFYEILFSIKNQLENKK